MADRARTTRAHHTGIEVRHQANCPTGHGSSCACKPTYRAKVYSKRDNRTLRKSFSNWSSPGFVDI
jgi:hypothetical protein